MAAKISPYSLANIRFFIAFRIFFNARFYYPVFTILFLDFGLTIEQFAILNSVWAATIVMAEVPSGALADVLGRRQLLLLTSLLMFFEMLLICFVPLGNMTLIFWVFLCNRVLSGLAEAMASGADEALAYDTLVNHNIESRWPHVLSLQMRLKSLAAVLSMALGALLYDPDIMNALLQWLGSSFSVTQQITMRYPLYLTLLLSVLACYSVLKMNDPQTAEKPTTLSPAALWQAGRLTLRAGGWICTTPFALAVILFGMSFDHVLRMIVTMTSQYFRLIHLPEASFGLIGAGITLVGLIVPKVAQQMTEKFSPIQNMLWVAAVAMAGLLGLTGFFPYVGILPMALIFGGMMMTSFFTSHYLNRVTASHQRATVLSFKGLAFNLAYGTIGLLFAALMQQLRGAGRLAAPDSSEQLIENLAFQDAIGWFPWYTVIILVLFILFCSYNLRTTTEHRTIG